jgi:hypothetical protein
LSKLQNSHLSADIVIVGGGTGGVAAAIAALRKGRTVILSEETDWIGGQFTSQAVPPDENRSIEAYDFGATETYRELRAGIRDYYRRWYPLTPEARADPHLNPGGGWVSPLCHEPRIALAVMEALLQPFRASGRLTLLLKHVPVAVDAEGDRIECVTLRDLDSGDLVCCTAPYFLDATECGDVLPLAGAEYVTGAESQAQTGEPHAVSGSPQPDSHQAITWCFAMSHHPGENHTITRPDQYEFWRTFQADFWPDKQLSWTYPSPRSLEPITRVLFKHEETPASPSFWPYRQIVEPSHFSRGFCDSSVTIVNWPQNDYWLGSIIDTPEEEKQLHLEGARQLSLSWMYWLQTSAPRPDGGTGYPGLKLRPDLIGTRDGLAKAAYVRESRRIKAEFTVLEQHIADDIRPDGAEQFHDSVGIGRYNIDLHPTTGNVNYIDIRATPFQIPLGSLIPQRMENLLPACKNLGVTHITNGCYRLHPVEWNIGEAAGTLAAHCLEIGESPRAVRNKGNLLKDFQRALLMQGVDLTWSKQ